MVGCGLLLSGLFRIVGRAGKPHAGPTARAKPDKPLPVVGAPGWRERRAYAQPVTVGGVTFDLAWQHIAVVATTGARKSTLLAELADKVGKPCLVITGDYAPPLENWTRSVGGRVWTARGGIGWYPWAGDLEHATQRIEHMFAATSGDVGVHRSMVQSVVRSAWGDVHPNKRTLDQILEALPSRAKGGSSAVMVDNWTARLENLRDTLGGSLGTDLDIVETLRAGTSVMIALNSFTDVSNRSRFASIAVLEGLRAANTIGGIALVFDEVGLIGAEMFDDAVRVLRVRLCTGLFASQMFDDFTPPVRDNIGVYFLGQQSGAAKSSRDLSSHTTFGVIAPEAFGKHALPHGKFYVVHDGRVETAYVKTWQDRMTLPPRGVEGWDEPEEVPVSPGTTVTILPPPQESDPDTVTQADDIEPVEGPPEMPAYWRGQSDMNPADVEQLATIWRRHYFPRGMNGCYESTYRVNNRGRPMCNWRGQQWLPYALANALEDCRLQGWTGEKREAHIRLVQMQMGAQILTVQHDCANIKCTRVGPGHTRWLSRGENVDDMWERRSERQEGVTA